MIKLEIFKVFNVCFIFSSSCGKEKKIGLESHKAGLWLWGIQIQKEVNQNSQAVKKQCGPQKGYGEKRCEIQGGGQEMAVMVGSEMALICLFLPLTYHHSHFLAATLDFTSFFTIAFLRAALFFYSLAVLD